MEEELGSYFLTDYLVRHFDTLIIKGMGLDRFSNLTDVYFENYKKIVYLAQTEDLQLKVKAQEAALKLGLSFEYKVVGYGSLATALAMFDIDPPKQVCGTLMRSQIVTWRSTISMSWSFQCALLKGVMNSGVTSSWQSSIKSRRALQPEQGRQYGQVDI